MRSVGHVTVPMTGAEAPSGGEGVVVVGLTAAVAAVVVGIEVAEVVGEAAGRKDTRDNNSDLSPLPFSPWLRREGLVFLDFIQQKWFNIAFV